MVEASVGRTLDAEGLYGLLEGIEHRAIAGAKGLPQQRRIEVTWEGVLFTLSRERLVAALDQVKEILNYPDVVTRVPGTRGWVKGIANVRGDLLPLIDLESFLWGHSASIRRRSRILVIEFAGQRVGMLVGEMVGIRHFSRAARMAVRTDLDPVLAPYVTGAYGLGDELWSVFDVQQLAADPRFRVAAG